MMTVQNELQILKQAQQLDREIYALQQALDELPEQLEALEEQLAGEKSLVEEAEATCKQVKLTLKSKENDLADKEANIRKYNAQLAQVKTNKEYSALQSEIIGLKADAELVEDEILRLMDEEGTVEKKLKEERTKLAEAEQHVARERVTLEQQGKDNEARLHELTNQKAALIQQVPRDISTLYEKIVRKKRGVALAPVQGESCGACQMKLRPQVPNDVKLAERLVLCENCSRILYFEDE